VTDGIDAARHYPGRRAQGPAVRCGSLEIRAGVHAYNPENLPLPKLRKTVFGSSYFRTDILAMLSCYVCRGRLAGLSSRRLSKSAIAFDQPDICRVARPRPAEVRGLGKIALAPSFLKSGKRFTLDGRVPQVLVTVVVDVFENRPPIARDEGAGLRIGDSGLERKLPRSFCRPGCERVGLGALSLATKHIHEPVVIVIREHDAHPFFHKTC